MTTTSPSINTGNFNTQLAAFLAAERSVESGNNYTAYNPGGGASGAYQYIQSTWSNEAIAAGYSEYANAPAASAPPSVQDAVAAYNATQNYKKYQNWADVAESWYYPTWAGNPAYQNSVPDPSAGNTLSVGQYGSMVTSKMNSILKGQGVQLVPTDPTQVNPNANTYTLTAASLAGSGGFLQSFNQVLNPGTSLDPFTTVSHSIDMAIVRGALALVGLLMIASGFAIITIGSLNLFSVGKQVVRSSKALAV